MGCANRKLARKTPDVPSTVVKSTCDKSTIKKRRERFFLRALLFKRKGKTESCTTAPSTTVPEISTSVVVVSPPLDISLSDESPESIDGGDVGASVQAVPVVDLVESNDHDSIDNVADIIQGEERDQPVLTNNNSDNTNHAVQEQLHPEKQDQNLFTKNSDIAKSNIKLLSEGQGQIHLMENSDGMELNAQAQKLCLREQVQNVLRENSQPDIAELTVQKPQLCEKQDQVALKSTDKVSTDLDIQNQTFPEGRDQTMLVSGNNILHLELPESLSGFQLVSISDDESKEELKCEQHSENNTHAHAPNSSTVEGFPLKDVSFEHNNQLIRPLGQTDNGKNIGNADLMPSVPPEQSDQQLLHSARHINEHGATTSQLFQPCKPKWNSDGSPHENSSSGQVNLDERSVASTVDIHENEYVHRPTARNFETSQSKGDDHKKEYIHQPMARKTYQSKVGFHKKEYIHQPMVPKTYRRKVELSTAVACARQNHYKKLILHYWLERCSIINEISTLTKRVQQYERELRLFVTLQNLWPCKASRLAGSLIGQRQKRLTRKQHKLYEKKRELATTEARLDHFIIKHSPDLRYSGIYTSRELHYLSPIPEEIHTDVGERIW